MTSLEAAGFKATPLVVPNPYDMNIDPDAPVNLRIGGWCPDWPSGSIWFPPLFDSESQIDVGPYFDEPEIDAEIERIAGLPIQEQPAAWGELDRSTMTDYYPVIVTRYQAVPTLHGSRIGGVNVDSVYEMPTWKDIHVVP